MKKRALGLYTVFHLSIYQHVEISSRPLPDILENRFSLEGFFAKPLINLRRKGNVLAPLKAA
jgi:hypothetical protein